MKKIVLFADCIPVKGAARSIICDLGRSTYDFIPNSLCDLLYQCEGKTIEEVEQSIQSEDLPVFNEYLNFLLEKEYIFLTDDPAAFPKLTLDWDHPAHITNAIIDFDANSDHDTESIIRQLSALFCESLEIRTYFPMPASDLSNLLTHLRKSSFSSVQLLLHFSPEYSEKYIQNLATEYPRILTIIIHSVPKEHYTGNIKHAKSVFFIKNEINSENHCGAISKANFTVNIPMFTESTQHNNCLNRKISVDKNGLIRNCPSHPQEYGHHKVVPLKSVLDNESYKAQWKITKNEIEVCRDCEFRYICTDCRVYTEDQANVRAKPSKCTYDPYKAVWN